VFDNYSFDPISRTAEFYYHFANTEYTFCERIQFAGEESEYDADLLERALTLAHFLIGTSYYKTFPTTDVRWTAGGMDEWQAMFFSYVYQEGLSQFAFENQLMRADLAHFHASGQPAAGVAYKGDGIISLQSGGKDSLLVASLLSDQNIHF